MAFMLLMHDNESDLTYSMTNSFPNVGGMERDSLATLREGMGGHMDWANHYRYVPGLREDDPGDLILMYLDVPTRWTWHGPPPTIFGKKAWIVVPIDFKTGMRPDAGPGELSERISAEEFTARLKRTLDFIRTNRRPNWETVLAEHSKFLESMESAASEH
ncbi:MAG: hypothetical protein U1F65_04325 [Verrucomicrobiota bacterium]